MHANDVFCAQKSFPMIPEMRVSMVAIVHLDHNGHSLRQEVIWCQARVRFGRPPLTSPIYLIKTPIIRSGPTASNAQVFNI
jgi:hypothetical protein